MKSYKNILVILDAGGFNLQALEKAFFLTKFDNSIKVKVLLPIFDFSLEITSFVDFEEKEEMLNNVIQGKLLELNNAIKEQNINTENISTNVVWARNPFTAIQKELTENSYDLIIKAAAEENDSLMSFFFTPVDWKLMRISQIPVIMVKNNVWKENGIILVALCSINQKISNPINSLVFREAQLLALLTNSEIHLVNSVPCPTLTDCMDVPVFLPTSYNQALHEMHLNQLHNFAESHKIPIEHTYVVDGLPDDVIPSMAKKLSVNAVFMGSIGRDGFSGSVIGNTAEQIIDEVSCDLIVIKTPVI